MREDINGDVLGIGDLALLLSLPAGFTAELPQSEAADVRAQVGQTLTIESFSQEGLAELEFTGPSGHAHWIWVPTACLKRAGPSMV